MRICVIGKFPPIEGGVSMWTYWSAHRLAARGHDVHVVTNAKEAQPPFRMHMRGEDWARCAADYGRGRVTVHWTDPVDTSQLYLPMASPFVSKLSSLAARVCSEHAIEVIFSHYLEPYGVAGHLAADITGLPHVVRVAGSDSGRLWRHRQFEPLYDHVLRSAQSVIAAGVVAARAKARGVDPMRIVAGGGFTLPDDLFTPFGPALDFAALRREFASADDAGGGLWGGFALDRPFFGIYGKLGERKGSFALLEAMARLKRAGLNIGLVALAHGQPEVEERFRRLVKSLDLFDRVLQIPFLPHWRVPEFLRSALAVCCLEQNFPIAHHAPIVALEVLLCGKCLVASSEIIRKLPDYRRLPNAYGCVEIADVNDSDALSARLAAIVEDPAPAAAIGARGYAFAREQQEEAASPDTLERILEAAASRKSPAAALDAPESLDVGDEGEQAFPFARLASSTLAAAGSAANIEAGGSCCDLNRARQVLAELDRGLLRDCPKSLSLASALRAEIAIALARSEGAKSETNGAAACRPVPAAARWGWEDGDIAHLFPLRKASVRILSFDYDISEFQHADSLEDLPDAPNRRPSYVVVFGGEASPSDPLLVDRDTARILELSDGTRTTRQIIDRLKREAPPRETGEDFASIETLFVNGLIGFTDSAATQRDVKPRPRGYRAKRAAGDRVTK